MTLELEKEFLDTKQLKPLQSQIKIETLALYQQAGSQSGYDVSVTAQEGEEILVEYESIINRIKVSPGFVQITINVPANQPKETRYSPFWATYDALKASSQNQ